MQIMQPGSPAVQPIIRSPWVKALDRIASVDRLPNRPVGTSVDRGPGPCSNRFEIFESSPPGILVGPNQERA